MRLANAEVNKAEKIANLLNEINNDLISIDRKSLDETRLTALNDALAVRANLSNIKNPKDFKESVLRIASLTKIALDVPDTLPNQNVCPKEFRIAPQEQKTKWNEDIKPRAIEGGTEYKTIYTDDTSNLKTKTKSMYDPILMAEKIIQSLNGRNYVSAQDAFDGFCNPRGPYGVASPYQKVQLAYLLQSSGFLINCSDLEKQAEADKKEYIKLHCQPKGDKTKSEDYKTADLEIKAKEGVDKCYCNKCGGTTDHTVKNDNKCCNKCGTTKTIHVKNATLDKYIRASSLRFADDGMANVSNPGTVQPRPDIVNLAIQKLKQMFSAFQGQQPTSLDVSNVLSQTINQYIQDPVERKEESEYLLNNEAVMHEIGKSLNMSTTGSLKQAFSNDVGKK